MTVRTLDAKTLWWHDAEECTCDTSKDHWMETCHHQTEASWAYPLNHVAVGTTPFITDRFLAFPAHLLDNAPPADRLLTMENDGPASKLLGTYLSAPPLPDASLRWFRPELIDPVEAAGFTVRPLGGQADTHGVCDPDQDGRVVGLIMPIRATAVDIIGRVAL